MNVSAKQSDMCTNYCDLVPPRKPPNVKSATDDINDHRPAR